METALTLPCSSPRRHLKSGLVASPIKGVLVALHSRATAPAHPPQAAAVHAPGLVIVRRGSLRRRVNGADTSVGPSMACFDTAGSELQTTHTEPETVATMLAFSPARWKQLVGHAEPSVTPVVLAGDLDLAHRRLVSDLASGTDPSAGEESLVRLVGAIAELTRPAAASKGSARTDAPRRLADAATEIIAQHPTVSLIELARLLGYSPYHVSRTFRAGSGITLTRFRNRVRTALALERLEGGEQNLAALAIELGFADQAHMTRVVRTETGLPPGRVRQQLSTEKRRVACP